MAVDGRPFYSEALDVIQRVFGYAEFRPGQFEAISAALSKPGNCLSSSACASSP